MRLSAAVRAIEYDVGTVRVLTDDEAITAEAIVVAVPLALLPTIEFRPALPERITDAWRRTGWAHNAKLHVPLSAEPAAVSAVQSVEDRYWTWTATDGSGRVQPVLHAFAGTPSGLDHLDAHDDPSRWVAQAAELRPDLALDPARDCDRAVVTNWADDPWARLSYSAWTVDWQPGDEDLLAEAVGPIHFAGEHTAGEWAGYMEGALRSGARAAGEIIEGSQIRR